MPVIEMKRAVVRTENGHQVIVLPDDIHFDEAEVSILHNLNTGELTVKREGPARGTAEEFFAFLDSLNIPQDELDSYMVDRPLNVPLEPEEIYRDDE
jgi:hypothetical protein